MSYVTPPGEADGGRGPRACVPCARAKTKCEIDPGSLTCKRCRRLKKSCTGQTPGAHRRNKIGRISDVARLEQKLDGVAAVLAASERVGGPNLSTQAIISNPALLSPIECVQQVIKDDEAALILDAFRADMAPYLPFVVIPQEQTVDGLRQLKPFLFMTIMTIGCRHDLARQAALARKLRELICHKMLLMGEQTLDLLQGLLIFIAWYHVHAKSAQLSNLVHLMMALVTDLGLNKSASSRSKPELGPMGYFGQPIRHGSTERSMEDRRTERTLEERRAFLGGIYVTTMVSIWAREMEPLKFSMYADECCRVLEQANEYPGDRHLVTLMRIVRMVGRIRSTLGPEEWDPSTGMSAPVGACVKSLAAELEQLKSSLSQGTYIVSLHYSFVQVFLYEVALHDTIASSNYGTSSMTRLKMLCTCLDETKRFFDKFAALPTALCFNFTYFTWGLSGHVSIVLSKLCIFAGDGWDPTYARSTFDFPIMVDMMLLKFHEAKNMAEQTLRQPPGSRTSLPTCVPELFMVFEPKLRHWRDLHMHRAGQVRPVSQAAMPSPSATDTLRTASLDDELLDTGGDSLFDFLDSSYWSQFI